MNFETTGNSKGNIFNKRWIKYWLTAVCSLIDFILQSLEELLAETLVMLFNDNLSNDKARSVVMRKETSLSERKCYAFLITSQGNLQNTSQVEIILLTATDLGHMIKKAIRLKLMISLKRSSSTFKRNTDLVSYQNLLHSKVESKVSTFQLMPSYRIIEEALPNQN